MIENWVRFRMQVQKSAGPHQKIGVQNMQNFGGFLTTFDFDREYPEGVRISKIGKLIFAARFLLCSKKKSPVNFGPLIIEI